MPSYCFFLIHRVSGVALRRIAPRLKPDLKSSLRINKQIQSLMVDRLKTPVLLLLFSITPLAYFLMIFIMKIWK